MIQVAISKHLKIPNPAEQEAVQNSWKAEILPPPQMKTILRPSLSKGVW